jgi:hypothetical protein
MKLTVDIKQSTTQISKDIANIILAQMKKSFQEGTDKITQQLPTVILNAIKSQPEYRALTSGDLRLEFGLTNAVGKVDAILDIWANSVQILYLPPKLQGYQTVAVYNFEMIQSDYSDVLSSIDAQQVIKNGSLPWLEWLLKRGGDLLVPEYTVKFGPSEFSRTGDAIMVESNNGYRVDPKYAGDVGNNWVTRATESVDKEITKLITNSLKGTL